MRPFYRTVRDIRENPDLIRRRRYGVIEMADQCLQRVTLRPFPKMISVAEVWLGAWHRHRRVAGDRCSLYYNQPLGHSNYLTAIYIVSNRDTTLKTFRGALVILDEIARIKGSDAILCEISNLRISDRLLQRWGWEAHVPDSARRHFIKRFYGDYPSPEPAWQLCCDAASHVPVRREGEAPAEPPAPRKRVPVSSGG